MPFDGRACTPPEAAKLRALLGTPRQWQKRSLGGLDIEPLRSRLHGHCDGGQRPPCRAVERGLELHVVRGVLPFRRPNADPFDPRARRKSSYASRFFVE